MQHHRPLSRGLLLIAIALAPAAPVRGEGDSPPDWARELRLVLFGGRPGAHVEILLNGQFLASFDDSVPSSLDVADVVRAGENELTVKLTPLESPRAGDRLEIAVAAVHDVSTFQSEVQHPLIAVELPDGFRPEGPCEEVRRFWAGPPPHPAPALRKKFWLFVSGPPIHHTVAVVVNGMPVSDLSSGNEILEITDFLVKGKNTVEFDGRPTCIEAPTGRTGPLTFAIGPAEREVDVVRMTDPPVAVFEIDNRHRPDPFTKKLHFRAW